MKLFKTSDVNVKTCQIKIALVDFIENLCHISLCARLKLRCPIAAVTE